ncbi:MAG: TetR/AcrR family transcriptional regulator C-terminal domain-containing protein [Polyangiaceae bacterium]
MATRLPVYRQIADGIRRQIELGELTPGDRVPSTRELARAWGTATATAAQALRSLAHAGVIRAIPRIGNVVAPSRGGRARSAELGRERIVEAALAIADAEGLPALSLRGVAAKLGTPVMSLYRHVPSKDALLTLMTDAALGEEKLPADAPRAWRHALEVAARASWQTLKRHPWLVRTLSLSRPQPLPNAIRYADWILAALQRAGVEASTRMKLHITLHAFVQGLAVNLESESEAVAATGMNHDEFVDTQLTAFRGLAATGAYPAFAATLDELGGGFDLRFDELFELGLTSLLDGMARLIDDKRRSSRKL